MKRRQRIHYTEEQKSLMWDRWQKGETLGSIARLFDRYHSSIERIIAESGGIRPVPRCLSSRCLSLADWYYIVSDGGSILKAVIDEIIFFSAYQPK